VVLEYRARPGSTARVRVDSLVGSLALKGGKALSCARDGGQSYNGSGGYESQRLVQSSQRLERVRRGKRVADAPSTAVQGGREI